MSKIKTDIRKNEAGEYICTFTSSEFSDDEIFKHARAFRYDALIACGICTILLIVFLTYCVRG